jgi:hypothetical protein
LLIGLFSGVVGAQICHSNLGLHLLIIDLILRFLDHLSHFKFVVAISIGSAPFAYFELPLLI